MIHMLLAVIYLSFISLGLPDGMLGSAWPVMHQTLNVPVSFAGILSGLISVGTIISSLNSDRLTAKLGAGKITALSVLTTAAALIGFSCSKSFLALCIWALPYGLGAGSVDAALNNYVALHYASRHMSWLHCMWGVGTATGPYVISMALTRGQGWEAGYRYIGLLQVVLTVILLLSLPLWKGREISDEAGSQRHQALSLPQIIAIPGAKATMLTFFFYCAVEQTAGLWASSYLNLSKGMDTITAARWGSFFFIGITIGRAVSGFITMKLNDTQMIHLGEIIVAMGILVLILPVGIAGSLTGLILVGIGCAPIFPSVIHATPEHFGSDRSQAIIGVQMASAYVGTLVMPPLFGLIANHINIALFPAFLLFSLIVMVAMYERVLRKDRRCAE